LNQNPALRLNTIRHNLLQINARIRQAALRSGRDPESVRLVAVTKTVPAELVQAAVEAGAAILGENYIQEARPKIESLAASAATVSWHLIGHLQTNKAAHAVRLFDLIHSVDSIRLAQALDRAAARIDRVQSILVQVNVAGEETKSGVALAEARKLVHEIAGLKNVAIKGLMTIPPYFDDPARARPCFDALRSLRDEIRQELEPEMRAAVSMHELSMGMSGDFEMAIAAGATLVRIGTAIFGERA